MDNMQLLRLAAIEALKRTRIARFNMPAIELLAKAKAFDERLKKANGIKDAKGKPAKGELQFTSEGIITLDADLVLFAFLGGEEPKGRMGINVLARPSKNLLGLEYTSEAEEEEEIRRRAVEYRAALRNVQGWCNRTTLQNATAQLSFAFLMADGSWKELPEAQLLSALERCGHFSMTVRLNKSNVIVLDF